MHLARPVWVNEMIVQSKKKSFSIHVKSFRNLEIPRVICTAIECRILVGISSNICLSQFRWCVYHYMNGLHILLARNGLFIFTGYITFFIMRKEWFILLIFFLQEWLNNSLGIALWKYLLYWIYYAALRTYSPYIFCKYLVFQVGGYL